MDSDSARAEKKRIENKKKRERRAAKQAASSVDSASDSASAADAKRPRVDAAAASDAAAKDARTAAKSKALDIWDANTVCDAAAVTPNGMRKPREFTQPLINEELWRVRAMASLKTYFEEQCAKHGGADMIKVIMAFERWHCRGKLREELRVDELRSSSSGGGASASSTSSCLASLDPLLPTALGAQFASAGLVADLTRVGMKPEAACSVAKELAAACAKAVAASPQHPSKVGSASAQAPAAADASAKVVLTAHHPSNDLVVGAKLFKINHAHLQKMRALFDRHASSLSEAAATLSVGSKRKLAATDADANAAAASDSDAFHTSLFAVLARYHALGGPGYQVALNEHAFEVLHARLGVDFECFASPLNARFARFCSAHPDTDAAFGSLGSFFACRFNRGSFFAHPPIVPELMKAMAMRVNSLLAATGGSVAPSPHAAAAAADEAEESAGAAAASTAASASAGTGKSSSGKRQRPLSFVVMVPEWRETDMFQTLHASPYLRASWVVDAAEHGVTDGVQHQRQDRFRAAPFATCICVLQNDAAARRWPVSDAVESEMREAMLRGVPSAAAVARRMARARGAGEADGGGKKQYQGKRENKCGLLT